MIELHEAFLSLGSNIKPWANLPNAVEMLAGHGEIRAISNVWETEPVGTTGANYLNACVLFQSNFSRRDLKKKVVAPIEVELGRNRSADKFSPRPIDIDIIVFDGKLTTATLLDLAYVVIPLAEILPSFRNPATGESLEETAARLRRDTWLEARQGVLE